MLTDERPDTEDISALNITKNSMTLCSESTVLLSKQGKSIACKYHARNFEVLGFSDSPQM